MGYSYHNYLKLIHMIIYCSDFKINLSKPSIMDYKNTHKCSLVSINYSIDYLV